MSVAVISPVQLHQMVLSGKSVELIDVRTPAEFREVHATAARNLPLDQLDAAAITQQFAGSTETVYVICRSGSRGRQACEKLQAAGLTRVVNVEGGTQAWDQAGLPVVRGRKCISLERQVRIAAGAMALTGAVLSVLVHPWWVALSGFVGAGLMFAGITDTCGMGMLLARMPWNQVAQSASEKSATSSCTTSPTASCCG